MKKQSRTKRKMIIIAILVLILALLAYVYFITLKSGGGIKSAANKKVGSIEFLFSVYGPGRGEFPRFKDPMAVATDENNNIYVSDTGNNRVVVFDSDGEFMFEFGSKGVANPMPGSKADWAPGKFSFPYGIDVESETGNIFVADMINKRIQIFDRNGKFLDWFPKKKMTGGFAADVFPTDIAVEKGKVYVCNPYQVLIFTTKGELIKQIGMPGDTNDKKIPRFDRLNGIDVGPDGTIYAADSNNLRIQAIDPNGKVKWIVGEPSKAGAEISQEKRVFGLPRNVSVGPDGNVYVADPFHFQIKVFAPDGKQLASMGKQGTEDGNFDFPNGIELTKDKVIYVVDKGSARVQAVRLTDFAMEDPLKM